MKALKILFSYKYYIFKCKTFYEVHVVHVQME